MLPMHDLHTLRTLIESSNASMLIIDKKCCLHMIEQMVLLETIAERWHEFLRFVRDNSINAFVRASADLELSNALFLITSIQAPDITTIQGKITIQRG